MNNKKVNKDFSTNSDHSNSRPYSKAELLQIIKDITKDSNLTPNFSSVDYLEEIANEVRKKL